MSDAERASIQFQTDEWVAGRPHHNVLRDECCPDFSCCCLSLIWPEGQRREFAAASEKKREQMMMMGLGAALAKMGKRDDAYICRLDRGSDQ